MAPKPRFELKSLHIRGLRGLQSLDLPADGLGWENGFPPLCVVAGANGSGKTTLLHCLAQGARLLTDKPEVIPKELLAASCRIDFTLSDGLEGPYDLRVLVGDQAFVGPLMTENCFGYLRDEKGHRTLNNDFATPLQKIRQILRSPKRLRASAWPRLVFFPSDDRDLVVPDVGYRAPGKLADGAGFVETWKRLGPKSWSGSTVELFFSARWADLNAKERGDQDKAVNFDLYARAFSGITGGRKKLIWTTDGDLVVGLDDGTTHALEDLSSGERQALLLLAELRRRWRPGSLVLIDELELHLHDAWQGKLLEILTAMQAELGGQVIITTQSHSLFEMAPLGTGVLLGRDRLK